MKKEHTTPAFQQNVIALIWDFDKTLIPNYMQEPLFKKYDVNEAQFWSEVNQLKKYYQKQGINVNPEAIYLNHILTYVKEGKLEGLSNQELTSLGRDINFFPGLPDFFHELVQLIEEDQQFKAFDIKVEHYIVSNGLAAIIRGTEIAKYTKDIWGCEFIEEPAPSGFTLENNTPKSHEITQIGYAIDNTTKTRALFEINKGSNIYQQIDVNAKMDPSNRRIPFENMIYIADGPSDVPAFSVIKKGGGLAYAIYPKGNVEALQQVDQLLRDGRIHMYSEADYSKGTQTYLWLTQHTRKIAEKIVQKKEDIIKSSISEAPKHI